MQVSTSLASLLRQPNTSPRPSGAASSSHTHTDSTRASGGAVSSKNFGLVAAGHHHHEHGGPRGLSDSQATDHGNGNQGVRRRLAALDRMVSGRLESFADKHNGENPGLADDLSVVSQDFHANLKSAYDTFRDNGDHGALMKSLRGAFAEARSAFNFVAATVNGGASSQNNTPVLVVDPGQAPNLPDAGDAIGDSSTDGDTIISTGDNGGTTVVDGAEGSGVTVEITSIPETDNLSGSSRSGSTDIQDILNDLVAKFADMMSGLEGLIDNGLGDGDGDPSFKLAVNLYAEFQFGGSSLGDLIDSLS